MRREFVSDCGCKASLIKWNSKTNMLSMVNCPLHKNAKELLDGCRHALDLLSGLSVDGEITMTPEGKDAITKQLREAISKAEAKEKP